MNAPVQRRAVVIDTDPGLDDAVAILLALNCPQFDVLGITTVAGNIGIEVTTRNAGSLVTFANRADIPVLAGAAGPLKRQGFNEAAIHGNDGLGGVTLPEPALPAGADAVGWLATGLSALPAGTIDILALGPLTNIAQLVETDPQAAGKIGRIIAMGGTIHEKGNVGPRSEFNVANDPEAADIVFRSGIPLTLIPLDVTRKVRAGRDVVDDLAASGRPAAEITARLIQAYFKDGRESRPLHDPCVMVEAVRPDLFQCQTLPIAVDLGTGPDAGTLSVSDHGTSISVALDVDAEAVVTFMADRLRG